MKEQILLKDVGNPHFCEFTVSNLFEAIHRHLPEPEHSECVWQDDGASGCSVYNDILTIYYDADICSAATVTGCTVLLFPNHLMLRYIFKTQTFELIPSDSSPIETFHIKKPGRQ